MTVVAICADSGVAIAESNCLCMNAFPIRQEGPFADTASLHHGFIAVTPAASFGNVRTVDRRLRIGGRQECCPVPVSRMAIQTLRTLRSVLRKRMEAAVILAVRGRVEQCATEKWQCLPRAVTTAALEIWFSRSLIWWCGCRRRRRTCRAWRLRIRTIGKLEKAAEEQH